MGMSLRGTEQAIIKMTRLDFQNLSFIRVEEARALINHSLEG